MVPGLLDAYFLLAVPLRREGGKRLVGGWRRREGGKEGDKGKRGGETEARRGRTGGPRDRRKRK